MNPTVLPWQRINRNSNAQFMRSRCRFLHVSKQRITVNIPDPSSPELVTEMQVWTPGVTYRKPKESTNA